MNRFPTEYLAYLSFPKVKILSSLFYWICLSGFVLFGVLFGLSGAVVYIGHPISCDFIPEATSKHDHDFCYLEGLQPLDNEFEEEIKCGYFESDSSQDVFIYQVRYLLCLSLFAIEG